MKAVSPTGVSQWSSYARADIPAEADPADLAPSGLSAKAVFDDGDSAGVELAWDAPVTDAASVTGYEILRAVGDGDLTTLAADTGFADTTYTDDTATEAGERYAYRVKALRGEEKGQPSDRAEVIIPKVTVLPVEPPIAEEQNVETTAWVSNTAQTLSSSFISLGNTDKKHSQGFRTGAEPGGYSLGSVGVYVRSEDLESGETFTVHIYTANASGAIDTLVHTLISPDSYADGAVNLFTAPADATLAANTDYLVVFEATGNAVNDFTLGLTNSTSEDSGSAMGWSIEDSRRFDNGTFSGILVISVNAAAEEQNEAVWSASLTPVSFGGFAGCTGEADNSNQYCSAAMTDDSFEYDGTSYTIYSILVYTGGNLEFNLTVIPTDATIADLTLKVGGSPFPLSDATLNGSLFIWANSGLTLTADTDVTVSLTVDAVSADATLSALSLSGVTLSPGFAADTLTYTGSVGSAVTSTTVTATANDDGATVAIVPADADDTADGHQVTLGVGDTAVSVTVTAEDGTTTQTYAVTVTRAAGAAPAVSSVDVTSDPGGDDTYAIGETVQVTVTFDQVVTVDRSGGTPRIQLRVGGGEDEHLKWAGYTSGSGTRRCCSPIRSRRATSTTTGSTSPRTTWSSTAARSSPAAGPTPTSTIPTRAPNRATRWTACARHPSSP